MLVDTDIVRTLSLYVGFPLRSLDFVSFLIKEGIA